MRAWLVALVLMGTPVVAADPRLDGLHADLAVSETPEQARRIANEIWEIWLTAPDPKAQALLDRARAARLYDDRRTALAILKVLTDDWPDYAEGWNQTATVLFEVRRDEAALAAVTETLIRNPRHFGALAGRVLILRRMGREADARRSLAAALAVHPWLSERALFSSE